MSVKPWTDAEVIRMAESLEDHCARQAATLRELLALRAIVAKLPKTKDGVVVVPGMMAYLPYEGKVCNFWIYAVHYSGTDFFVVDNEGEDWCPQCEMIYSTREAAEAAKANRPG